MQDSILLCLLSLIEAKNTTKAAIIQSCGANFAGWKKEKSLLRFDDAGFLKRWRKEGDSNPRYPFEYVSLANWWFQPLTHPSRDGAVVERRFSKRSAKIRRIFESANFFGLFYFANIPYFCRSYINESRSSIDCLWQM